MKGFCTCRCESPVLPENDSPGGDGRRGSLSHPLRPPLSGPGNLPYDRGCAFLLLSRRIVPILHYLSEQRKEGFNLNRNSRIISNYVENKTLRPPPPTGRGLSEGTNGPPHPPRQREREISYFHGSPFLNPQRKAGKGQKNSVPAAAQQEGTDKGNGQEKRSRNREAHGETVVIDQITGNRSENPAPFHASEKINAEDG